MAASESIPFNSNAAAASTIPELHFALYPLRFRFMARRPLQFSMKDSANLLRGQLGKALFEYSPNAYQRLFSPTSSNGPSGLRDLPRPFVLRVSHLNQCRFQPGQTFDIGVNLFDLRRSAIAELHDALCAAVPADFVSLEGDRPFKLSLEPRRTCGQGVRVRFVTPTELKGSPQPDFAMLFSRLRDRISTLRALYSDGPLPIDFKSMGLRAEAVRMTKSDLRHVEAERVSRRTGQRHSLGGFVGSAEYEGELAEFLPYLEAGQWSGVGRQTVWGKGEIVCEEI